MPNTPADRKVASKVPVLLLSHGLGGSRDGFPYLGEFLSKHGYAVLVMQHPGSDKSVLADASILGPREQLSQANRQKMSAAVNRENARARYDDVVFLLDELQRRDKTDERFEGRLDLDRIAVGGHSFGAFTTLSVLGRFPYKAEPRLKAGVAMSPNSPRGVDADRIHRNIRVPILHLTGTKDDSPLDPELKPADRRIPYDKIHDASQYLVVFRDGDHMLFSGHRRFRPLNETEQACRPIIAKAVLRFLDAHLKNDAEAQTWMQGDGLRQEVGTRGTVEIKTVP